MSYLKNLFYELFYGSLEDSHKDIELDFKVDFLLNKEPRELLLMGKVLDDIEMYITVRKLTEMEKHKIKVVYEDLKTKLFIVLADIENKRFFENLYVFLRLFDFLLVLHGALEEKTEIIDHFKTYSNLYPKTIRKLKMIEKDLKDKKVMIEGGGKIEKTYIESHNICEKYEEEKDFIRKIITSDFVKDEILIFDSILDKLEFIKEKCKDLEERYKKHQEEVYGDLIDYIKLNYLVYNTTNRLKSDNYEKVYDISRWLKYYDIEIKQSDVSYIDYIDEESLNTVDRDFERLYENMKSEENEEFLYEDRKNFYKRLHYLTINNPDIIIHSDSTINKKDNTFILENTNLKLVKGNDILGEYFKSGEDDIKSFDIDNFLM